MDKVIALNCPGCNQPVSTDQVKCRFCKRPIVVQRISEIQSMPAVEMSKYMNAYKSIVADNPAHIGLNGALAVCHLRGKKPFQCQRSDIDAAIKYVNAANSLQPNAMNHLLLSYIKQDYFERKYLQVSPSWRDELEAAESYGANEDTVKELCAALNVQMPGEITKRFEAPTPLLEPTSDVSMPMSNGNSDNASSPSILSSLFGKLKRR